ncbi:nuclear transport factor 2 family protein [Carboxylicivirga sediminis]|uniref:Nuclear transport factor 2 family protein n=1 Tax=Carboxylicivirga sediminis TaxID=2006564 RepID=A0A941IY99_9BACT|nr:nuclear transport factor 2 family protein [Carboxylicivirga sediminis]MBR8535587.1 nuclear transport factor 2 family protein [Carboxylicivirga sediminis]
MKRILLISTLLIGWGIHVAYAQSAEQEIKQTIEDMIQAGLDKDVDKTLSYWDQSPSFTFIADGHQYDFMAFKDMYTDFLNKVESQEVTENKLTVKEIGKYKALCIWTGTEKVKMKEQEPFESKWISTLLMENKKGGWVILHGHTSHF